MKKLLTTALLLASLTGVAQTFKGSYSKITTDHFKGNQHTSTTIKFKAGFVVITTTSITIDTTIYSIIKKEAPEIADENFYTQSMVIASAAKKGSYKVIDCVIELRPDKKTVDYIQLRKTKSTKIGYDLIK